MHLKLLCFNIFNVTVIAFTLNSKTEGEGYLAYWFLYTESNINYFQKLFCTKSSLCSLPKSRASPYIALFQSRPMLVFLHQMTQMCTTTLMETNSFCTFLVRINRAQELATKKTNQITDVKREQ